MEGKLDRGAMHIELAGRPLVLRYSLNSLCDIELVVELVIVFAFVGGMHIVIKACKS